MNDILNQFVKDNTIDSTVSARLDAFVKLFEQYNAHTNLSAIRKTDDIWQKHIIDSLMVLRYEDIKGTLLDIGTGGGLPGIPLALARPELQVTLLDSVGKKTKACQYFIDQLQLKNVCTVQARAELLGQDENQAGKYDVIVSRATAYLPTLLAWSEQLVRPGGKIILYKSPSQEELKDGEQAAKSLGMMLFKDHVYTLDGQERHLLVYVPIRTK